MNQIYKISCLTCAYKHTEKIIWFKYLIDPIKIIIGPISTSSKYITYDLSLSSLSWIGYLHILVSIIFSKLVMLL